MIIDTVLFAAGQGKYVTVINGLRDQVSTLTTYVSQMQGSSPITDATEATNVYNAYKTVSRPPKCLLTEIEPC